MRDYQDDLRSAPVGTLLCRLSFPAALGMAVQASYGIVDAFFVGWGVGPEGIAAVSIAFPLQMILMAMAQAIGVGGASVLSRSLGAGRRKRAERTLGTLFSCSWILGILFAAAAIPSAPILLRLLGAGEIALPLAEEYTRALFRGAPFFAFSIVANNFVRAEGNASFAMMTMLISAGINIMLDPLFIFGFGWGIRGAALATVVSQGATALWLAWYYLERKSAVRLRAKNLPINKVLLKESLSVGAAAFFRQGAASLSLIVVNSSLASAGGDVAVAAYGIASRILLFAVMPVYGIVQGLLPIVGFNYGARQFCRMLSAMRLSIVSATLLCSGGAFLLFFFPGEMLDFFTASPEVRRTGIDAARMLAPGMVVTGFQIMASGLFQAIGKAGPSFVLSLLRQVLFLIPLVLVLSPLFGLFGIWLSFPAADLGASLLTFAIYRREILRLRRFCAETGDTTGS
jgi:putative MATE family efflux protein